MVVEVGVWVVWLDTTNGWGLVGGSVGGLYFGWPEIHIKCAFVMVFCGVCGGFGRGEGKSKKSKIEGCAATFWGFQVCDDRREEGVYPYHWVKITNLWSWEYFYMVCGWESDF